MMKTFDSIQNKTLRTIAEKVAHSVPISPEDALSLLSTNDILDLGSIAHHVRTMLHGRTTYYGVNTNLNYTNICELRCPLCAFSRDENDPLAFLLSLDDIKSRVTAAVSEGIDEVHIVGGLNSRLPLEYYEKMITMIKSIKPDISIVAFTTVEYDYLSKKENIPLEELFRRFLNAGVDAIPGGGAEIFSPRVRKVIAPKKISGERWLEVMSIAHRVGLKSNATMLYNHIENKEDIVGHLIHIRNLQNETGGFKTFVPLRFHGENTQLAIEKPSDGYNDIRIYATSRIFLHNVPHVKALWMYVGEKMGQLLQMFGVDDIGATYYNEKVVHAAGAKTPDFGSELHLRRLIEDAGMTPKRTTANYV